MRIRLPQSTPGMLRLPMNRAIRRPEPSLTTSSRVLTAARGWMRMRRTSPANRPRMRGLASLIGWTCGSPGGISRSSRPRGGGARAQLQPDRRQLGRRPAVERLAAGRDRPLQRRGQRGHLDALPARVVGREVLHRAPHHRDRAAVVALGGVPHAGGGLDDPLEEVPVRLPRAAAPDLLPDLVGLPVQTLVEQVAAAAEHLLLGKGAGLPAGREVRTDAAFARLGHARSVLFRLRRPPAAAPRVDPNVRSPPGPRASSSPCPAPSRTRYTAQAARPERRPGM